MFRIWSNEHDAYWRPARNGYTRILTEAGSYSYQDAVIICCEAAYSGLDSGKFPEVMVPIDPFLPNPVER